MVKYREILRLRSMGVSQANTAKSCGCARSTVESVELHAKAANLAWPLPEELTDEALKQLLFPPKKPDTDDKYPIVHKDVEAKLNRRGVTLMLCWNEYCEEAVEEKVLPFQYSAFCRRHRQWQKEHNITMHVGCRIGEKVELDWVGDLAKYVDPDTQKTHKAYIFVACLPWSQYIYAEAFDDMSEQSWIKGHVDSFEFFGGVPLMLVPDNCKTAVTKHTIDELILNEQYRRMAEHYGCCVVPAPPRSPRSKPSVEAAVGLIERQAMAPLRDEVFLSLSDLNEALQAKIDDINSRPFQNREGSRQSEFLGQEKDALMPLPAHPFVIVTTAIATVPFNYHISFDGIYYSVPYTLLRQQVEVRATSATVEIYCKGVRVATHQRLYGRRGQYQTNPEHMPEAHKDYAEWDGDRFRRWGASIDKVVEQVIDGMLKSRTVEQQAYRACRALINLGKKYGNDVLIEACKRALTYTHCPSYKTVKNIASKIADQNAPKDPNANTYLRGPDYFSY